MQAIESARLPTQGGATGLPPVPPGEMPPFVRMPAEGGHSSASGRQAFGRRLTAARERRGVSVEDIAQTMKVSPGLLAALERGDASRWPKGLFRRAFFRDYVAAIGLAPDPYIGEFLELFPDGEVHPVAGVRPEPEAAPFLRLALAPASRWHVSRARLAREAVTLVAVLALAALLTLGGGGTPLLFLGLAALGYSGRLFHAAATRAPAVWLRLRHLLSQRQRNVAPPHS